MEQLVQLLGVFACAFGVCYAVSYLLLARKRKPVALFPVSEGTRVRMVGRGGVYRAHFVRHTKAALVFSAPLQRDSYVPLRTGDSIIVQAPTDDGVLTFRASVIERDSDTHEFTLAVPTRVRQIDRRSEPRDHTVAGQPALVNGSAAELLDLSASGAKLMTKSSVEPGDTVQIELPSGFGSAMGWILEVTTVALDGKLCSTIRIAFDQPLSGLQAASRRRLYTAN